MDSGKHYLDALTWIERNLEWWLKHGTGAPDGVVLVARALSETDDGEAIRDEVEEWKNKAKANLRGVEYNAALARAEKAEAEVEKLKDALTMLRARYDEAERSMIHEADRAEKAERERDEARKRYCLARATVSALLYAEGWETARAVCERTWPDAADLLFPVEVKPCG